MVFTHSPTCLSERAEKPERIFCSYAQSNLVSPSGRDVAQRQRGQAPSLRELDCRLAARLREQLVICHTSGKLLRRPASGLLLPSRLAPCHLPQGGRLLSCAQTKTEHLSILCLLVGGGGFEPPKSLTTDLQSAPFGHSGNLPYSLVEIVELVDGLEPPTC